LFLDCGEEFAFQTLCATVHIIIAVYVLFSTCPYGLWPLLRFASALVGAAAVDIHNDNEDAADEVDGELRAMIAILGLAKGAITVRCTLWPIEIAYFGRSRLNYVPGP